MKKMLSFLLVTLMLCTLCSFSAFAQNDELTEKFYDYCLQEAGVASMDESQQVRIIESKEVGVDIICFTATGFEEPANMGVRRIIGDWCVHSNATFYPYDLGVYVYTQGEIYDLETAYENNLVYLGSLLGFDSVYVHEIRENPEYVELEHTCTEAFAKYNPPSKQGDYIDCVVYGETDKVVVFRADVRNINYMYPCLCSEQRIRGYVFDYGYAYGPLDNPTGLYVLYNDKVVSAMTAVEEGYIYVSELASIVGAGNDTDKYKEAVADKLNLFSDDDLHYGYTELYAHSNFPSHYSDDNHDYVLVFATNPWVGPMPIAKQMGDYAAAQNSVYSPYDYGYYIYVPETDTVYTLEEAVEAQVEGIGEAFFHLGKMGGVVGDVDRDRKITIKDATAIQKIVAELEVENRYMKDTKLNFYICDYDRDDDITIKDATAIQKHIAGIKDNTAS